MTGSTTITAETRRRAALHDLEEMHRDLACAYGYEREAREVGDLDAAEFAVSRQAALRAQIQAATKTLYAARDAARQEEMDAVANAATV